MNYNKGFRPQIQSILKSGLQNVLRPAMRAVFSVLRSSLIIDVPLRVFFGADFIKN